MKITFRTFNLGIRLSPELLGERRQDMKSGLRRVELVEAVGGFGVRTGSGKWRDDGKGGFAAMTWAYHEAREAEIERLRKVVDVARNASQQCGIWADKLAIALRELEESDE